MKVFKLSTQYISRTVLSTTYKRLLNLSLSNIYIRTYQSNNKMEENKEISILEGKVVEPKVEIENEKEAEELKVETVQPKVKKQKVKKLKPIPLDLNLLFDLQTLNPKFVRNEVNEEFRKSLFYTYLPYKLYDEVEVTIVKIASTGVGIGQTDPSIDWYILVPFTSIGDVVKCKVYAHSLGYSEADLISLWQHLDLKYQIKLKSLQIKRCFLYFAKPLYQYLTFDSVCESPLTFNYRTKLTPHFDRPRPEKDLNIGFMEKGRKRIIDIENCILATEPVQQGYDQERTRVLSDRSAFKNGVTLIIRQSEIENSDDQSGKEENKLSYVIKSKDSVHQTVGKYKFIYPAGSFFQINASILPLLCDYVHSQLIAHSPKYLLDTYCGSGLFAVTCHQSFQKVYGIDINDQSIACASNNAKINDITNLEFTLGTASNIFEKLDVHGDDTAVIIDPPRKGCDQPFLKQLVKLQPKVVVYVSCNPFSQARDILDLVNLCGGYQTMQQIGLEKFTDSNKQFDDITVNSSNPIEHQLTDKFHKVEHLIENWDSLKSEMDKDILNDYKKFLNLDSQTGNQLGNNMDDSAEGVKEDLVPSTKKFTYKVTSVKPFDMFPMTMHIESVVTLVRVDLE